MMPSNTETSQMAIGTPTSDDAATMSATMSAAMSAAAATKELPLAPRLIFSAVSATALVSGVLASGAAVASSESWLALLIGLVLTQIVWNTLWATIAETDWAQSLHEGRQWQVGAALRQLPYTLPGSASAQASLRLGHLSDWLTQHFWPRYGAIIASTVGAMVIGLVLALVLGPQPAALTVAAVCVPQLAAVFSRGSGQPSALARGILMAGLPLLLGHALFAPLSLDILVVSIGFAVVFAAIGQSSRAGLRWMIGSIIIIGVLVMTRRPLGAYALAVLALPQVLLSQSRYSKAWLIAMLLAAATAIS